MRVVLLSSTSFGLRCALDGVLPAENTRLVGVITTPKVIRISYAPDGVEICSHADLDTVARAAGCGIARLSDKVDAAAYERALEPWQPDLLLVLGWYYNIPRSVRDLAAKGCIGIHASLLPRYRGGAPIPWAIINGEERTGVTLFHLEDEVDSGDVIAQQAFPIEPQDTCATVYDKAVEASVTILRESLPKLADGTAPRRPQDHLNATVFPQRKPEDGLIDWSWSPQRIHDFIRAQTRPYPGAYTLIGGKKVVIWDADVSEQEP